MTPDELPTDPATTDRDRLRYEVLNPLTVIYGRTELLQRIIQQTPRLTDLERIALLAGLEATLAAAHQLRERLEPLLCAVPIPEPPG